MKRISFILALVLFLAACGTKDSTTASFSGETSTFNHTYEDIGLELTADITVAQDIEVKATLKNVSGKTLEYNGRCGVPFYISMKMKDTSVYLANDQELLACEDIFDPNDIEKMKVNESFEKTVIFKREFDMFNTEKTPAHDGDYTIEFTFTTYGDGHFFSEYPIYLKHDTEPKILTLEEAKYKALNDPKVKKWHDELKEDGVEIKTGHPFLSEGNWYLSFHAVYDDKVAQLVVAVDYNTGEVKRVNTEEFEHDESMDSWLDNH